MQRTLLASPCMILALVKSTKFALQIRWDWAQKSENSNELHIQSFILQTIGQERMKRTIIVINMKRFLPYDAYWIMNTN